MLTTLIMWVNGIVEVLLKNEGEKKQILNLNVTVVQTPGYVCLFATPWTAECQASLSFTISQNLLRFISI